MVTEDSEDDDYLYLVNEDIVIKKEEEDEEDIRSKPPVIIDLSDDAVDTKVHNLWSVSGGWLQLWVTWVRQNRWSFIYHDYVSM